MTAIAATGVSCPAPAPSSDAVQLGHGSGGRMSAQLVQEHFLPRFGNPVLSAQGDAGILDLPHGRLAFSTDTFVVSPLEFPGGDIGALAVHGTVNDLAMMGAEPRHLSAGFVLEEGLPFAVLDRIIASMARAAAESGVTIAAADTKVVERGRADGLYVNTTGVGLLDDVARPGPHRARSGDAVLVSGPLGRHGMAVMAFREGLAFESTITSDTAALTPLVRQLKAVAGADLRVLRDPTRGGVATTLNEIARASGVGIALREDRIPVPPDVLAACEMLGLDPLYVANEGILVAIVPASLSEAALGVLRAAPLGREAAIIGRVVEEHEGMVVLHTGIGGSRVVDMLPGDLLPRIC